MHDMSDEGDLEETDKINVVPLADLTLVLLIILMVLSPMISQSMIHVAAPTLKESAPAAGATAEEAPPEPLKIGITDDAYTLNDVKAESLGHLMDALRARIQEDSGLPEARRRPVLVSAENGIRVGAVVQVLDLAKDAGASQISLIKHVEVKKEASPRPPALRSRKRRAS